MAFLVKVKKKSENKEQTACRTQSANGTHSIKVLGAGCKSCRKMYENARPCSRRKGCVYGQGA